MTKDRQLNDTILKHGSKTEATAPSVKLVQNVTFISSKLGPYSDRFLRVGDRTTHKAQRIGHKAVVG